MAEKHDYLMECNEFGVMASEFEGQFCFRCLQKECVRSQYGKSRFEARTGSWEGRLFTNVPRMNDEDPRFVVFRSKKFVDVETGPVPEVGRRMPPTWVDPRELDVAPESSQSTVSSEPPAVSMAPEPSPLAHFPLSSACTPTTIQEDPPAQAQPEPRPPAQFMNTPVQQGRMIGGRQPEVPQDPWEVRPPKDTQGLPVVKPGARIKIGGPGV